MSLWNKRRVKLTHDYSCVGWLLSPNPTVMADAKANATSEDSDDVERLLFKLLLPSMLVGQEREVEKGRLSQECWDAHKNVQNRDGSYNKEYIWALASHNDCKAYEWHQQYSKHAKVLCQLACIVLSKILGIGSAERSWKDTKKIYTPARNRTDHAVPRR